MAAQRNLISDAANVAAGAADNTYTITDLTFNATYEITIAVLYADGTSVDSVPVRDTIGEEPDDMPRDLPVVSNIQTLVGADHILVGWTNPGQSGITGFNVVRINTADQSDTQTIPLNVAAPALLTPVSDLLLPEKRVIYNITGLTNDITYNITIAVLYENGGRGISSPVLSTTGTDPSGGEGTDIDLDDVENDADAFPTDACASTDTDRDGMPDSLVDGCQTDLTADADVDGDGANDDDDNCPLTVNADQNNTDDVADGGDACDEDDDNDGVADGPDNCQFIKNSEQHNNDADAFGDVCDEDDDNDGVAGRPG